MKNRRFHSYAFIAVLAMAGCVAFPGCDTQPGARPDQPESPEAPPPPTPEEIAQKEISDLGLDQALPRRGARLSAGMRQNILSQFRSTKNRLSGKPEGEAALEIIKTRLEERIRAAERNELWEHTLTYIDAHGILDPDSKKFSFVRDRALTELRKPRVTVRGLPEFDGQKIAMLSIYLPMTSETHFERMRVGEEMHGIKLLGIFGEDKGVRIEYLETGDREVVYLPTAK